jgi:NYN domain
MPHTLTALDIENLSEQPITSAAAVTKIHKELVSSIGSMGLVVCGVSATPQLFHINAGWSGMQLVVEKGRDGAERALASHLTRHYPEGSLQRLVIVSGDHYFVELAQQYKLGGTFIDVVAREGSLSRELKAVADRVTLLPRLYLAA